MNQRLSLEAKCATIFHELGHVFCSHLGVPRSDFSAWTPRCNLEKADREFEAEAVAWLVCERLGIENPSAEYLSGYLDVGRGKRIMSDARAVDAFLKATGRVEAMLARHIAPLKELVDRTEQVG